MVQTLARCLSGEDEVSQVSTVLHFTVTSQFWFVEGRVEGAVPRDIISPSH